MSFTYAQNGSIGFFDCPLVVGSCVILGENTRGQIVTTSIGSPSLYAGHQPTYYPKQSSCNNEPKSYREICKQYITY